MKSLTILKDNKPILINILAESRLAKEEDKYLRKCEKYIAEDGYELLTGKEGIPTALEKSMEYFKDQGFRLERYVEMDMLLSQYQMPYMEVPEQVAFGFYEGSLEVLHEAVASVEEAWVQYFDEKVKVYCGFIEGEIASFCIVGYDEDCVISEEGVRIGSVGCVGTIPKFRKQGIGLSMVAHATQLLKEAGCDRSFIHYTVLEHWYGWLGYESFMSFYFCKK